MDPKNLNLTDARNEAVVMLQMIHAGRGLGPSILSDAFEAGDISARVLRNLILPAWCGAEWPLRFLPRKKWLELFGITGFVSDSERAAPHGEVEVWRAQVGRTVGLAWSTDFEMARWFHRRNRHFGMASRLLHGCVGPAGVLALVDARKESEVLVHPRRWRPVTG